MPAVSSAPIHSTWVVQLLCVIAITCTYDSDDLYQIAETSAVLISDSCVCSLISNIPRYQMTSISQRICFALKILTATGTLIHTHIQITESRLAAKMTLYGCILTLKIFFLLLSTVNFIGIAEGLLVNKYY